MATVYTAYPSTDTLETNVNTFLAAMRSRTRDPQARLFSDIAVEFVDVMLEALFFGPTSQIELTPFRKRLVDGLGGLIEKTSHGIIKSVISRASNDELRRLEAYVEERRVYFNDAGGGLKPHIAFPLTPHFTTRFMALHEATMAGSGAANVAEMSEVMCEFVDTALEYMYKRPIDLMQLGIFARKAADLGLSAVRSMSHSTIHKLSADISDEERRRLSMYFYELMKEGPNGR